jgi:hypothetical protein
MKIRLILRRVPVLTTLTVGNVQNVEQNQIVSYARLMFGKHIVVFVTKKESVTIVVKLVKNVTEKFANTVKIAIVKNVDFSCMFILFLFLPTIVGKNVKNKSGSTS